MLVHAGSPIALSLAVPIHTPGWPERGTMGVKCLGQEQNTISLTWTARSEDECTNYEAPAWQCGQVIRAMGFKSEASFRPLASAVYSQ